MPFAMTEEFQILKRLQLLLLIKLCVLREHEQPGKKFFVQMYVPRVAMVPAISFWVSSWWLPVSHPSRLCREHVRQLSYSKRLLVDGYTSTASGGNRRIDALRHNKRLLRFGLNAKRQRDVPTHVRAAVVAVSAGYHYTCAVRSDGQLVCFGATSCGQCDVPTDLGAVVAVSAGDKHTCAVRSDGQLVCFGDNSAGQCDVPTDLGEVVAVSAGFRHTCAVRSDGQLVCFGWNSAGQCDVPTEFGSSCGSLSRRPSHVCSEIRWSIGLLWT